MSGIVADNVERSSGLVKAATTAAPDTDSSNPGVDENPSAVGDRFINTSTGELFVTTDITTDENTDIGKDAVENEYGFWCQSGDLIKFKEYVIRLSEGNELRHRMGNNAYEYLKVNFSVDLSYNIIFDHFKHYA